MARDIVGAQWPSGADIASSREGRGSRIAREPTPPRFARNRAPASIRFCHPKNTARMMRRMHCCFWSSSLFPDCLLTGRSPPTFLCPVDRPPVPTIVQAACHVIFHRQLAFVDLRRATENGRYVSGMYRAVGQSPVGRLYGARRTPRIDRRKLPVGVDCPNGCAEVPTVTGGRHARRSVSIGLSRPPAGGRPRELSGWHERSAATAAWPVSGRSQQGTA